LVKLFQKLVGWKGEALLALRRARNSPNGVSFLITFFFAPVVSKKKVAKEFCLFQGGRPMVAPTEFRLFKGGRPMVAPTINAPIRSKEKWLWNLFKIKNKEKGDFSNETV